MKYSLGDAKTKALAAITEVLQKNGIGSVVNPQRLAEFIANGLMTADLHFVGIDDALALQVGRLPNPGPLVAEISDAACDVRGFCEMYPPPNRAAATRLRRIADRLDATARMAEKRQPVFLGQQTHAAIDHMVKHFDSCAQRESEAQNAASIVAVWSAQLAEDQHRG